MTIWATVGAPPLVPLKDGENQFALIDAAQTDRFVENLRGNRQLLKVEFLFGEPIAPRQANATPLLLAMPDPSTWATVVRVWGGSAESHGAFSCLVSPLTLGDLAQRLRARLDARLPDRFDCVNRFFDGRVTPHLYECLGARQRNDFFSVTNQWWIVEHSHEWQSLPCSFAPQDSFIPPMELDERQQAHLIDACYPYAVIEHFMQTDQELLETIPSAKQYAFFRSALAEATKFGIEGGPSAILFCTLALTRGPGFHRQAPWGAALEKVKDGTMTLQQAIKAGHHD